MLCTFRLAELPRWQRPSQLGNAIDTCIFAAKYCVLCFKKGNGHSHVTLLILNLPQESVLCPQHKKHYFIV